MVSKIAYNDKDFNKASVFCNKALSLKNDKKFIRLFKKICSNKILFNSAVEIIQNHLSFKVGILILSIKKNPKKIFSLLPDLIKLKKAHKKTAGIYKVPIEFCYDYNEALKIKKHLTYRLGNLLVKYPFTFLFRVSKVYKEWKREKGRYI